MANDFVVIQTGGKQYKVSSGQKLKVENLGDAVKDDRVVFDKVLMRAASGKVEIGAPFIVGAKVEAKLIGAGRGEKKIVFKYHAKARYRKKKGHRQEFDEVEII